MALHGDLATFGLPDLLQWLESAKATGCVSLWGEGAERRLFIEHGDLEAVAYPGHWERLARQLAAAELIRPELANNCLAKVQHREQGFEQSFFEAGVDLQALLDLAADDLRGVVAGLLGAQTGRFDFAEESLPHSGDERVTLRMNLRELLFEAFRLADEQPQVDRVIGDDRTVLLLGAQRDEEPTLAPARAVFCQLRRSTKEQSQGTTLGAVRLALGSSHLACARTVYELYMQGRVSLPGQTKPPPPDPLVALLAQGSALLRAGELEAAGLLCASLRSADPTDRRVREFARAVEGEQISRLYGVLLPMQTYERAPGGDEKAKRLRSDERQVLQLVNGVWDVATLVLASPLREIDTLRRLQRLLEMSLIRAVKL
jgi:hypothetical protein